MAKKFNWISGGSYGSIAGSTISQGFSYEEAKRLHKDFPGDPAMRRSAEWERGTIWFKIAHMIGMTRQIKKIYPDWIKFFRKTFNWKKAIYSKRLFIGFALKEEIGRLVGTPRCSFFDYIRLIKGVSQRMPFEELKNTLHVYYGSNDGIYKADPNTGILTRISNEVLDLADLILASFSNPLLGDFQLKINGKYRETFDVGIVNNHANLPFAGQNIEYQQAICNTREPNKDLSEERFVLSAYYYYKTKPKNVWYFPAKTRGLSFFEFPDEIVEYEFDGRGVEHNGYSPNDIGENWCFCGGAADGQGYSPFYKTVLNM